jgi:hypothetical protein
MIISLCNLKAGIHWWHNSGWPADMLNSDYYAMYAARSAVGTVPWWSATVNQLWNWKAIRPKSKTMISARGQNRLSAITRWYSKIMTGSVTEPCITDLVWEDVAPLYALAYGIKRGKSPVFASKMCHFLFPKLFVVLDNKATDIFEYEFCWRGMKDEWQRFTKKAEAHRMLTQAIKSQRPIHSLYPYETKIMELSLIGYNHR